jgi:hypothetical protein
MTMTDNNDMDFEVHGSWLVFKKPVDGIQVTPKPISTKSCSQCGCDQLSLLRSTNEKICTGCGHTMSWNLDVGQHSLITNNRMKGLKGE